MPRGSRQGPCSHRGRASGLFRIWPLAMTLSQRPKRENHGTCLKSPVDAETIKKPYLPSFCACCGRCRGVRRVARAWTFTGEASNGAHAGPCDPSVPNFADAAFLRIPLIGFLSPDD